MDKGIPQWHPATEEIPKLPEFFQVKIFWMGIGRRQNIFESFNNAVKANLFGSKKVLVCCDEGA